MKIYLTSGSMEFMESVRARYPKEMMVTMHGAQNSVLLHESEKKSVFATPRQYEVLESIGHLTEQGFFALNYIPINEDGQPIFEHQFKLRADSIEQEQGLVALRFLKQAKEDTYVVLTQWVDSHSFNLWRNSSAYHFLLEDSEVRAGVEKRPYMFTSAPYFRTYKSKEEDVQA